MQVALEDRDSAGAHGQRMITIIGWLQYSCNTWLAGCDAGDFDAYIVQL
jgi:hypothetical protein